MKRYVKILSSRDMAFSGAIVSIALTPPGMATLVAFIALGHLSVWQGREMLSSGWDPHFISPFSGLAYIAILILSVLVHEAGHLAAAAYRGDLSAGMYLGLHSWAPAFMTSHGARCTTSGCQERPALDLAGVSSQVLFASSLGLLFLLTGSSLLVPSILLIDVAALASLRPIPGADGYRFLLKSRMRRDHLCKNTNGLSRPYAALGLCIFIFYSALSLALLVFVIGQLLRETPVWTLVQNYSILENSEYVILLLPVLQYVYWALKAFPLVIPSLRHL